jgi:glycosyltransferase involved in cell wall biosynthesis
MNPLTLFLKNSIPEKKRQAIRDSGLYRFVMKKVDDFFIRQWISLKKKRSITPAFDQNMGVNLIGFLGAELGLGAAARRSALAFNTVGTPVNLINIDLQSPEEKTRDGMPGVQGSARSEYGINLIHINVPEYPLLWKRVDKGLLAGGYNIGVWYWELPDLPDEWRKGFGMLDEIWVATRFVQESIQKQSPIPVIKIPPCVYVDLDHTLKRSDFNLPEEIFLFLNAYDTHSVSERKNPLAAIRAFKEAFQRNDSSVGFVVKVSNAADDPEMIKQIKYELLGYLNCYLIEDTFPRVKFNSLLNLVDAFVSLHRSEGFGLIPAEAMFLGKPVIATNWSGNTDFMTADNSCMVDYQLIPVKSGLLHYQPGQFWADADISHAARLMKKLTSDQFYYDNISENARATMVRNFSPEKIGDIMKTRLEEIIRHSS